MTKVKNFFKRNSFLLILILGFLIAGANYLLYPTIIKKDLNLVDVPVAVTQINESTEITELMITTTSVTKEFLTDSIITDKDELIGKYVANNCTIPAGAFFYKTELADRGELVGNVVDALGENQATYTIELDDSEASTNAYQIKQTVNIYGILEYEKENRFKSYAFGELVHEAKIIAISYNQSTNVAKEITLAVDIEDLSYLHLVDELGRISCHIPYQFEDNNYYDTAKFKKFIDDTATIFKMQADEPEVTEPYYIEQPEEQYGE